MATRGSVSGWMLLVLCACFSYQEVTSQAEPKVLPPANSSDATYDGSVVINATATQSPQPAKTDASARPHNCRLVSVQDVGHTLNKYMKLGAKLVEFNLTVKDYPPNVVRQQLRGVFNPNIWIQPLGRQGRNLLVLEDNYQFMSLFFLSIGVYNLDVTLTDSPPHCLKTLNEEETLAVFRDIILNDFQPQEAETGGSRGEDVHVCNRNVKNVDGYAEFPYVCCHKGPYGHFLCEEVKRDAWIDTLLVFIIITKVLVVLYSPSFLPDSLYRLKFVATEYVYRIPQNKPVKNRFNMVITKDPAKYNKKDKVVKLYKLKCMKDFKEKVRTFKHDKIYRVPFDQIRLLAKSRCLLGEDHVPVGLLHVIYKYLIRCHIRYLEPLEKCCGTDILGVWETKSLNCKMESGIKLSRVMRTVAQMILLAIIISPWVIRVWFYFSFEYSVLRTKEQVAEERGLKAAFYRSLILYLSPLHIFFIIIYVIISLDSLMYGVLSKAMKEKLRTVVWKCLLYTRVRPRFAFFAWFTKLFVLPFEKCGLFGLLILVPYLIVLLPLALPVAVFLFFPAINLSVRIFLHFLTLMCPTKCMEKVNKSISELGDDQEEKAKMDMLMAQETIVARADMLRKAVVLQLIIVTWCLVSFWSLTMLLMEVVSFIIEILAYTLMGIIVNAASTLQFISIVFLTIMYGRSYLYDLWETYLSYHKQIHLHLLGMMNKINEIASREGKEKENTALCVLEEKDHDISLKIVKGRPMWSTASMLLFMDFMGTPFTPEKFFHDAIEIEYYNAPGKLALQYRNAFWSFMRIVVFLIFVFIVVMAFGEVYKVSSTNQLLATVAGGFIPFIFQNVFSSGSKSSTPHKDSMQFQVQTRNIINEFTQNWPVYDISLPDPDECEIVDQNVEYPQAEVDMIVSVSDPASGIFSFKRKQESATMSMLEMGSMSLLGASSFDRGTGSRSTDDARMMKHPTASTSEGVMDV